VQRAIDQTHLEEANRHIEAAFARLARLEGLVCDRPPTGFDAELAESLMRNMRISLCIMIRHRLAIRRTLAQAGLARLLRTAGLREAPYKESPGPAGRLHRGGHEPGAFVQLGAA
jgi:hypothetical protein